MEGRYKVIENINFEAFYRLMGVSDKATIEKLIEATKEVTLMDNKDGTWTQVTGLVTQTFALDKEYKVSNPTSNISLQQAQIVSYSIA